MIKNSAKFWDRKILLERNFISKSPIYKSKLLIVTFLVKLIRGKVLDIGFGYGIVEDKLSSTPDIDLYGVDISPQAVKKISAKKIGKFIVGNSTDLPFKSKQFNVILALDILEHLSDTDLLKTLKEISRCVKESGYIVISVPLNELVEDKKANHHLQTFTWESLIKLLDKYGYKPVFSIGLTAFSKMFLVKSIINAFVRRRNANLAIILLNKK